MGAVLEPTTAMGPYTTEARRESFYLGNHPEHPRLRPRPDGVALPAADVPAVLASLDQVEAHLRLASPYEPTPQADDEIAVYRDDDHVVLPAAPDGWLIVYGRDQEQTSVIEICYSHLRALRTALAR